MDEPRTEDNSGAILALTIWQPWASALIYGPKDIENRPWPASHRGDLAIHAGLKVDWWAPDYVWEAAGLTPPPRSGRFDRDAWKARLPLGAVLGLATLSGCHQHPWDADPRTCSRWAGLSDWHWEVTGKRPLAEPVPCRGAQRFWRLPDEVAEAVRAQLVTAGVAW